MFDFSAASSLIYNPFTPIDINCDLSDFANETSFQEFSYWYLIKNFQKSKKIPIIRVD